METNFLTAQDIAKFLKISKALAYRLISDKKISSIRFGRTVRVKKDALEEFVRKNSSEIEVDYEKEHPQQEGEL